MALNLTSLLPEPNLDQPTHDCSEMLSQVCGTQPDLRGQLMPDAEFTWYTHGTSLIKDEKRYAGTVVVMEGEDIWAEVLAPGTPAQKAELIALIKALQLDKSKRLNVYTDSRYAFAMAYIHSTIYQKRGFLKVEGKTYQK